MDLLDCSGSDTDDEDYVPAGAGVTPGEIPSEVDSDGDPEDPLSESEDVGKRGQKRRKKLKKTIKKTKIETDDIDSDSTPPEKKEVTEEDKKKRADSLWDMFKKDTGFKKKPLDTIDTPNKQEIKVPAIINARKAPEKIKVTQIFEFAGEEVKIEKEVVAGSAEARLLSQPSSSNKAPVSRKGGLGGIGSVLNQIGKKQKLSTLEKTALDWNKFKKEEKIEDELETYKKGKDGYLERQDFLQRADLRQFELEKEVRTIERNKRMNI